MSATDRSRAAIEDLFRLIQSGQLEHAESRCRNYLGKSPDDVNLLAMLGAICLQLGKLDEAQATLETCLQIESDFAKPYEDLGALHLRRDAPQTALQYFEDAIERDDKSATAWAGRANALHHLDRHDEARDAQLRSLQLSPVAQGLASAQEALANGDLGAALQHCENLNESHPGNIDVLLTLARIETQLGRIISAEQRLQRRIQLTQSDYAALADLGMFYGQIGRIADAISTLRKALGKRPEDLLIRQRLADNLAISGAPQAALAEYDTVLATQPDNAAALTGRAHMLRMLGDTELAIGAYEAAIDHNDSLGEAWWGRASMRGATCDDGLALRLEGALERSDIVAEQRIGMLFAMARICESRGDFAAAWEHYKAGNALKRNTVSYDPVRTERLCQAIQTVFDDALLDSAKTESEADVAPVFIVGMPRSGSTLVEQILASHSQVEGTFEQPWMPVLADALGRSNNNDYPQVVASLPPAQIAALGKTYLHHTRASRTAGTPYFIDKLPANFLHVGLIAMCLPDARIIDVRRDPLDTVVGNFRQLFAKGKEHAYDLFECAEYYLAYHRLMTHWEQKLPGKVLRVQYEELVAETEQQTRRILDYCNLDWQADCLRFYDTQRPVATASAEQVRAPVYTSAVGFWRNYGDELAEIRDLFSEALPN